MAFPLQPHIKTSKSFKALLFVCVLTLLLSVLFIKSSRDFRVKLLSLSNLRPNTNTTRSLLYRNTTGVQHVDTAAAPPSSRHLEKASSRRLQQCVHPRLTESDPVMTKFVKRPSQSICAKEEWLEVYNGTVRFSQTALKKYKNFTCDYYPLKRESESKSGFGEPIRNISDGFKMVSDFFKGVCSDGNGANNSVVYSGVHFSDQRAGRSRLADPLLSGFEGLSIAILGFDSMSRMSWLRRLKKTRKYFYDTMKGIELKGHNIVGDGTTAVILPMLTGSFEWELPECRVGKKMATTMDKFPWIWRDLAKAGYLTSWSNANPYGAPFNWRMHGFKEEPTDFYTRPYYLAVRQRSSRGTCDEGQTTSRRFLNYFRDIFLMYPRQRKFLFHFITDYSHDDNNGIMKMDDDLEETVRLLHEGHYLNNTLLILMGDHGARYPGYIRASWQGKMEERLPYFGFAFPPWFEKKYPQSIANLRINTERLTTPFDLHETFKDFLEFRGAGEGDVNKRGISLFKEVPPERTCQLADVAAHWCACLDWRNVSANDPGVQRAVQSVVDTLNGYTSRYREDCALLHVQVVGMANKLEPRREVLTFKGERLADRKVDLSGNSKNTLTLYQLMVTTQPGGGQFEVTVTHDMVKDKFSISEKEISRMNMYNDDPACILQKDKSIRAYCYCRNKLATDTMER